MPGTSLPRPALRTVRRTAVAGLVALLCAASAPLPAAAGPAAGRWTAAWTTAWGAPPTGPASTGLPRGPYTLRERVRLTAAGPAVRIRLSNRFGDRAATFGPVTLALSLVPGSERARPGSRRYVTFGGSGLATVAAGQQLVSDPVRLSVRYGTDLLVSTYVADPPRLATRHPDALATSWVAGGDHTRDRTASAFAERRSHYYLTGVDVAAVRGPGVVVAFGDSITDGLGSSFGDRGRWPDRLADRLRRPVVNAGISGSQLLAYDRPDPSAMVNRLDRDVLALSGVRTVIVLGGVNDLRRDRPPTAAELVAGYQLLIGRARAAGVRVVGGTIVPFGGDRRYTVAGEWTRQLVNQWTRTSGAFDAVVDFDAALRDPVAPYRMDPRFHPGDGLHPNDTGYRAMAAAVDPAAL